MKIFALILRRKIYGLCRQFFPRDNGLCEDLYYDVLGHIWFGLRDYRDEGYLSTRVYRVTLNTARSHFRDHARQPRTVPFTPAAVVYWRHTVPLAECSEVYRQYRHQPGVRAAFIRQMRINDTLRLDMTLLEAEDSAFAALLLKMGKTEEYINYMFDSQMQDEDRFTVMMNERAVIAIFPSRKAIALFETENKEQQMILLIGNRHPQPARPPHRNNQILQSMARGRHLPNDQRRPQRPLRPALHRRLPPDLPHPDAP